MLGERRERLVTHPWLVGDPALPGVEIGRRVRVMTIAAVAIANAVGAAVVLTFAFWALPKPAGVIDATVDLVNLTVAVGYLLLALVVGVAWGRNRIEGGPHGIRGWLFAERAPSARRTRQSARWCSAGRCGSWECRQFCGGSHGAQRNLLVAARTRRRVDRRARRHHDLGRRVPPR